MHRDVPPYDHHTDAALREREKRGAELLVLQMEVDSLVARNVALHEACEMLRLEVQRRDSAADSADINRRERCASSTQTTEHLGSRIHDAVAVARDTANALDAGIVQRHATDEHASVEEQLCSALALVRHAAVNKLDELAAKSQTHAEEAAQELHAQRAVSDALRSEIERLRERLDVARADTLRYRAQKRLLQEQVSALQETVSVMKTEMYISPALRQSARDAVVVSGLDGKPTTLAEMAAMMAHLVEENARLRRTVAELTDDDASVPL